MTPKLISLAGALCALAAAAQAQPVPQPVQLPAAEVVRRYSAPEARQGVAVDAVYLYAVTNNRIGKYDKTTGAKLAEWTGDRARFPHINSCTIIDAELVCASSNYPAAPHWSAVEVFDPATLTHKRTIPLGPGTGHQY